MGSPQNSNVSEWRSVQWISHEMNIRHPWQLKKSKSWGPNIHFMWNPLLPMPPKSWHNNSFLGSVKSDPDCALSTLLHFHRLLSDQPRYSKFNSKIKKLLAEIARGFAEICWFIQKMTLKWHYFITKFVPFLEKSSLARAEHNINMY